MSIAAANLFTRNIYREFFRPDASTTEEAKVAKVVSLIVKLGALLSSVFALHFGSVTIPAYAAVWALLLNLIVSMVLTWVFNALSFGNGEDRTRATDYVEDTAPSITV